MSLSSKDRSSSPKDDLPAPRSAIAGIGASLARFALNKPVTIGMLFLSMLLFGVVSGRLLPLEKFPGIDIPEMVVQIPYPDATPIEIETMITRPVEEAVATMSGIKRLRARSYDNMAEVVVEFDWDENLKAKSIEAREKIDAIRHELPSDIERIMVYKFNTNDMPIFQLRVSSDRDLSHAYDLLERNLKRPLERVPGVSKVELYGTMKRQITIRLDPKKMTAYQVDTTRLEQKLQNANFSLTAGYMYNNGEKVLVNPTGEFTDINDFKDMWVTSSVRLSDIATVTYELPERSEGRHLDRTFAVGFNVFRESGSNLVEVSGAVMKVVNKAKEDPEFSGINLFVMDDTAKSVTSSLGDLVNAGLLGALLSVIVLYLFLRQLTTTLIVVLSVPFSICITLGVMYLLGYTLNILSLMGLMLAVGMLVDNAVVITESVFQERQQTRDIARATQIGVNKVSLAVIAGTATTAIVFLPNIVGVKIDLTIFLEHVAVAICISLFASLFIAKTLIPLLTTKVAIPVVKKPKTPSYIKRYGKALQWMLKNQGKTCLIAIAILGSTIIPMQSVTSDDEGNNNQERIWLNYHVTQNFTLEEVEKTVNKMEAYLYENKDKFHIKQVYTYFTPGHAVSGITLNDNLPIPVSDIKEAIRESMPSFVRARPSFQWDTGNGGGVRVTLLGESSETLLDISEQIIPILGRIEGLEDVKADTGSTRDEVQIHIDRQKANRFGIQVDSIANLISTALRGNNLRSFRYGDAGEVGVQLKYGSDIQASLSELKNVNIGFAQGQSVTLNMIADFNVVPQLSQINRNHRQTALAIGANLAGETTTEQARERIENALSNITLPTGYQWTLDGSFTRQDEANSVMQMNMLLALCMIYVVMAALFESLILPTSVITSLLFSFTGVFWAFMVTGTSMSIMGMIGMLILMGIVVNNGIVLVDRINQLVNEGITLFDAVVEGCMTRIRPILMTVATTVLGLIPLAMGSTRIGGDGPPYSPMAIAIIGGLVFSTMTSLFLVPLAYVLLLKLRFKTQLLVKTSKARVGRWIKV
ncbi:acriflavin resistance protein [Alteromonas sp. KUL42]|uniref:efflux RND transporter permease subunit n=1 Tax=Alteromonas sp. KUL42 TaxID=2480797 RepID=UPI00103573C9|nr:efflux RND transporter permease subunit [Alteromonas sp. KUL42]TAP36747.1 efflux RND transporter permease subunit [Alteromonas sp. KUL42]GEA06969.1 acriflavin resistance protein [Alteromonas sp. KUL42]